MGRLLEALSGPVIEWILERLDIKVSTQHHSADAGGPIEKREVTGVRQQEEVCLELGLGIDVVDRIEGCGAEAVAVEGKVLEGDDIGPVHRFPVGTSAVILRPPSPTQQ